MNDVEEREIKRGEERRATYRVERKECREHFNPRKG